MRALIILLSLLVVSLQADAQSWTRTAGPVEDDVLDLCIDSNGILYAVTPFGVNRSTNGGEHWTRPFMFPAVSQLNRIVIAPDGNIIASSFAGIFHSTDSGNTFTQSSVEMVGLVNFVIQFATSGTGRMFATHVFALIYSDDNGRSWTNIDRPATAFNSEMPMYVAASHDTVIVQTDYHTYASFNNGKNWQQLPGLGIVDPQIQKLMILPDGRWGCVDYLQGLLLYTSGVGWTHSDEVPMDTPIYSIDCMSDGSMLISSSAGVHRVSSADKWSDITSGLTRNDSNYYHPVTRFVEDPATGAYYAATFGAGVWKRTSPVTGSRRASAVAAPFLVSPNPFTNTATVHFTEPHPSWSEIELRNILGAVVWKQGREYAGTGTNTLSIKVQGLAAGNYLLVLRTADRTESQWVTIVK